VLLECPFVCEADAIYCLGDARGENHFARIHLHLAETCIYGTYMYGMCIDWVHSGLRSRI
jgi:hypothetical protein